MKMFKWFRAETNNYEVEVVDTGEFKTNWKSIYIVALVAFIGSVDTSCIIPVIWPYMKLLMPDVSENFFGILSSITSAGVIAAALFSGYISNLLRDTTLPMLFGKIMIIFSCILYMTIELVGTDLIRLFFIIFKLTMGISMGAANIFRSHVAMASTEEDRARAVGICSFAPALGVFVGSIAQIIFTTIGYPGIPFIFGTHINTYTAPVIMVVLISIIGALLLAFCFDGKMRVKKDIVFEVKNGSNLVERDLIETTKYDKVAVILCLYTKMLLNLCTVNFNTIGVPYAMLAFGWTSVLYISVCMILVGLNLCFWNLAYVFCDLRKRMSERQGIVAAIVLLLGAYLLTYPWPFINETIPYQVNSNLVVNSSQAVGCPIEYTWCGTTPRVNMHIFLGSLTIVLGIALPLCQINLDILYSKILGNIKQGTLQGVMIVSGETLNIGGPLLISRIYTLSGPIYIWLFEIAIILLSILIWIIFYKRMIGKSERAVIK